MTYEITARREPPGRVFLATLLPFAVGLALITAGILAIRNGNTLWGLLGAFLAATGVQIVLWSFGVRSELLGTVPENPSMETEAPPSKKGRLDVALDRALGAIARAEQSDDRNVNLDTQEELLQKIESTLAKSDASVQASVLAISMELERAARKAFAVDHPDVQPRTARRIPLLLRERGVISPETEEAYDEFWRLRNMLVHDTQAAASSNTKLRIADIGTRLLRLFASPAVRPRAGIGIGRESKDS